jgi:hypothetical protein
MISDECGGLLLLMGAWGFGFVIGNVSSRVRTSYVRGRYNVARARALGDAGHAIANVPLSEDPHQVRIDCHSAIGKLIDAVDVSDLMPEEQRGA